MEVQNIYFIQNSKHKRHDLNVHYKTNIEWKASKVNASP